MPRPAHALRSGRVAACAALAVLLHLPAPVLAQDHSPIVLRVAGSTRAGATGGAFPLGQRDSDAIFANAAFGDALRGFGVAVQRFGGEATLVTASAGIDWWGGAVGVGVRSLTAGHVTALPGAAPITESALYDGGPVAAGEQAVSVAFARRIRGVRLGVTGHYVAQRRAAFRDETFAVDLAAGHELGPLRVGVAARNFGPALATGAVETPLPALVAVQAATSAAPVGPLDVALAGVLEHRLDAAGGTDAGVGAELSWWPIVGRTFSGRVGARTRPAGESALTLGAGFTGDRIAIDYAWRALRDGGTHRIGVRWR